THPQRGATRPGMRSQGTGRLGRGSLCCRRGRERDEEGIALSINLGATMGGKRGAQERLVLAERARVPVPQLLQQLGAALDVGEEEGDGAGRQSPHARSLLMRLWPSFSQRTCASRVA